MAPLAAFVGAVTVGTRYGWMTKHGRSFFLVAAGFASYVVAETIFLYYDFYLGVEPFPTVADWFFVAAAPLISAGIVSELFIARASLKWSHFLAIVVAALLAAIFLAGLIYHPEDAFWHRVAEVGYIVTDVALLVACLYGLRIALEYGGQMRKPWFLTTIAAALYLVADFFYLLFIDQYVAGEWLASQVDLLWVTSYIAFAWAMISVKDILDSAAQSLNKKISL